MWHNSLQCDIDCACFNVCTMTLFAAWFLCVHPCHGANLKWQTMRPKICTHDCAMIWHLHAISIETTPWGRLKWLQLTAFSFFLFCKIAMKVHFCNNWIRQHENKCKSAAIYSGIFKIKSERNANVWLTMEQLCQIFANSVQICLNFCTHDNVAYFAKINSMKVNQMALFTKKAVSFFKPNTNISRVKWKEQKVSRSHGTQTIPLHKWKFEVCKQIATIFSKNIMFQSFLEKSHQVNISTNAKIQNFSCADTPIWHVGCINICHEWVSSSLKKWNVFPNMLGKHICKKSWLGNTFLKANIECARTKRFWNCNWKVF